MFIPEANAKTVKIPARFIDGNLINLLTKQPVSGIINNTFCEIILNYSRVEDKILLEVLDIEETDVFLPEATELFANISQNNVPNNLKEFAIRPQDLIFNSIGFFVQIILAAPLYIKLHGTKQPNLLDCKCYIPSLNKTAESLNHAYTLISTEFEPHRRSHSGNVFQKIFYKSFQEDYTKNHWIEIGHLRNIELQKFYNYLGNKIQSDKEPSKAAVYNHSTYEILKPFLTTALREFNQDLSDLNKARRNLTFVLNEKFKFDEDSIVSLKPYITKLFEEFRDNKESHI